MTEGRVLSEEDLLQTERTYEAIEFVDVDYVKQTVLNLIATIRDRDKTATEWKKMCDKQTKHWLTEQAENQKLQRQNTRMLQALEQYSDPSYWIKTTRPWKLAQEIVSEGKRQCEELQKELGAEIDEKFWIEKSVRPPVQWFAGQMEAKLRANDHKGGWSDCNFRWLYQRLLEEVHEVWIEYNQLDQQPKWENVIKECADVANFAMMIADKAREAIAQTKGEVRDAGQGQTT